MGNCIYCGQPAGFLRSKHSECARKHDAAWAEILSQAKQAAMTGADFEEMNRRFSEIAATSYVKPDEIRKALIQGWEQAANHFLGDGNLDAREEASLTRFAEYHGFTQEDLDQNGTYTRFVKGAVLRELMEGKIPTRFRVANELPLNFQKGETIIWGFNNVVYYEDKTRKKYVGGSRGVSVRIARGVYYRFGGFQGYPVETTERVHMDTGFLIVTNKHLYFHGPNKSFRMRLDKIVSFTPYSDGVAVHPDSPNAKPKIFVTGDGWFTYNLLVNLGKLG